MQLKVRYYDTSEEAYEKLQEKDPGAFYLTENNVYLGNKQLNNTFSKEDVGLIHRKIELKDGIGWYKIASVSITNRTNAITTEISIKSNIYGTYKIALIPLENFNFNLIPIYNGSSEGKITDILIQHNYFIEEEQDKKVFLYIYSNTTKALEVDVTLEYIDCGGSKWNLLKEAESK